VQHVLPDGFHKIRHYGLYAGAAEDARLVAQAHLAPKDSASSTPSAPTSTWAEQLREVTGRDVQHCPHCGGEIEHRPVPAQLGRAPPLEPAA